LWRNTITIQLQSPGATHGRSQASREDAIGSVVIAAVIALHEPIAASGRNIFLVETTSFIARYWLPVAVQMFEVQLDQARPRLGGLHLLPSLFDLADRSTDLPDGCEVMGLSRPLLKKIPFLNYLLGNLSGPPMATFTDRDQDYP
jgi:hypothetical protein